MLKTNLFYQHTKTLLSCYLLFFMSIYILSFTSNIQAATNNYMKCWKNYDGVTECGNRVPREYYNQRVRFIDDRGVTRNIKEKSKTKEEKIAIKEAEQQEKERLAIEDEQKRKQKSRNNTLLKTYLGVDDILNSMNSKIDLINSRVQILQDSLPVKQKKFDALVKEAANMERSGKKLSKNLIAKLDALRAQIKNTQLQLEIETTNKITIKKTYRNDIERFVLLKTNQLKNRAKTKQQQDKLHIAQIFCHNKPQCHDYWQQASQFIKTFSGTKITYQTDIFSVSDTPKKPEDIAMTLALLGDTLKENTKIIFLQIRCHRESIGQKICVENKIKQILNDFREIGAQ